MAILACVSLLATLTQNKVKHERHGYHGMTHPQISAVATVLDRIRAWYVKHGVLSAR